jgi:hypothetical protein
MEKNNLSIQSGCKVVIELIDRSGETERRSLTLVPTEQADFKSGLLDENTPLGQALLGHFAGQTLPYRQGDLKEIRILSVEPPAGQISSEAADQRRADVKSAEAQSEITSQMIFASARGSKWGEYEVNLDKLLEQEQKKKEKKKDE